MTSSEFFQSFLTHFVELRSRSLKALGFFIVAAFACFHYAPTALQWLIKPAGPLVFTTPAGAFSAVMSVTVVLAMVVSSPVILYQLWAFVASGLKPRERRALVVVAPLSLVFFAAGVIFAYAVAAPFSYKFLLGFASDSLRPMISVDHYLGFLGNMVLAFGTTFELPLVLGFLAHIGVATPEYLRQKRKHAILLILVVAAVLTPPDLASQMLLALPLVVLYEMGIICTRIFQRGPQMQNPLINQRVSQ